MIHSIFPGCAFQVENRSSVEFREPTKNFIELTGGQVYTLIHTYQLENNVFKCHDVTSYLVEATQL